MKLKIGDPDYPDALRELPNPPAVLTTSGPLVPRRAIAIVGSRDACAEALVYAHGLAYQLARAGVLVISGGAVGVDGAAHRGALAAGGPTWVVSPTGKNRVYPREHASLFAEIASSSHSRMLWPFDDDMRGVHHNMRYRNGVLAALSEALIMVQAHYRSGSRNAAAWARSLGRPVWAVSAAPWMGAFCGSLAEIADRLATPLCSAQQLFHELDLGEPAEPPPVSASIFHANPPVENHGGASKSAPLLKGPPKAPDMRSWSQDEKLVFSILSMDPIHIDKMVGLTLLPVPPVATALLTLRLKDVVVEGPEGFFRRKR